MAAIYSNGGNRWNILGFNFTKRDALSIVYIRYLWSGVKSVLLFMNADPSPYPDQDKTVRHESISRLRSSAFVHNEYSVGKIRCELRSERRQKDKDGI
jgi:hypothetical protein